MKFVGFVLAIVFCSCTLQSNTSDGNRYASEVNYSKEKVMKSDKEWKAELTEQEYHVTREKGTEHAFSGAFDGHHEEGTYICTCCKSPLFESDTKFNSGSGWPSFFKPVEDRVGEITDSSHGMSRTEVVCQRCEAHLGHVFNDGPKSTGLRYCINSVSLKFVKKE
jgi:peptide-methionine (R)-S-oxide reductase